MAKEEKKELEVSKEQPKEEKEVFGLKKYKWRSEVTKKDKKNNFMFGGKCCTDENLNDELLERYYKIAPRLIYRTFLGFPEPDKNAKDINLQ